MALKAAKHIGGFDRVIGYGVDDIDELFFSKYENILSQERGGGYWLWKPYLIRKTMAQLSEGDYLFYSDAGAYFLKNANVLIDELENSNQDIMAFELPLIEEQWSKKELFINMKCEADVYFKSNQIAASLILIKKTKKSIGFVEEYLKYACNEINITDLHDNNVVQKNNYIDHRHDQSIFSLLYKKYSFRPFKDPTQFGKYPLGYSGGSGDVGIEEAGQLYTLENGRLFRFFRYDEAYEMVLFHSRTVGGIIGLLKFFIKVVLYKTGISDSLVR
ncbi:hypothetical protein ACFL4I_00770 [Pseudomonadota bacterium]